MNLKSLEYFLVAAEEMNFTRAAGRLFVTQQALSSHIKRLEDEYGVHLFERRPALHLTQEGKEMVFYARRIMEAENKMHAAFSDISKEHRGALKVGISRLRATTFFPQIWSYYHHTHPNISIELIDGNSDWLEDQLQAGKLDLYIGIDVSMNPNQQRIELAREKLQCCISQKLLVQYRPENWQQLLDDSSSGIDLTQIMDLPFIIMRQNNRLRRGLENFFSQQLHSPRFLFECNQQELIYELAKSGTGVGLASPVIFYQHAREIQTLKDFLHIFPVRNEIPGHTVFLVYRNDYQVPRYAMDLIQVACMVFRRYMRSIEQAT